MPQMVKFSSQMERRTLDGMREHANVTGRTLASLLTEASDEYLNRTQVRPHALASMRRILRRHRGAFARLAD